MKIKNFLVGGWSLIMIISASLTFYIGIKNLNLKQEVIAGEPLKKITFDEIEWRSFINSKANIDESKFKSTFLRKLDKAEISNISFVFDDNKVVAEINFNQRCYKWFYNLDKNFSI